MHETLEMLQSRFGPQSEEDLRERLLDAFWEKLDESSDDEIEQLRDHLLEQVPQQLSADQAEQLQAKMLKKLQEVPAEQLAKRLLDAPRAERLLLQNLETASTEEFMGLFCQTIRAAPLWKIRAMFFQQVVQQLEEFSEAELWQHTVAAYQAGLIGACVCEICRVSVPEGELEAWATDGLCNGCRHEVSRMQWQHEAFASDYEREDADRQWDATENSAAEVVRESDAPTLCNVCGCVQHRTYPWLCSKSSTSTQGTSLRALDQAHQGKCACVRSREPASAWEGDPGSGRICSWW